MCAMRRGSIGLAILILGGLWSIDVSAQAQSNIEITISPEANGVTVDYQLPQICLSAPFLDSRATVGRFFRAQWQRTDGCLSVRGSDLVADAGPCRHARFFIPNDTRVVNAHYAQSQKVGEGAQLFYPAYALLGTRCAPTNVTLKPASEGGVQILGSAARDDGTLTLAPEKIESAYVLFASKANIAALRANQHLLDPALPAWLSAEVKRSDAATRVWMRDEYGALSEPTHLVANRNDAGDAGDASRQHGDVADPRAIRLTFYKPEAVPSLITVEQTRAFIAHELGHVLQPTGLPRIAAEGSAELFSLLAQINLQQTTLEAGLRTVNAALTRCFMQLPEQTQPASDRRDPYACGLTALTLAAIRAEGAERGGRALMRALALEWKSVLTAANVETPAGAANKELALAVQSIANHGEGLRAFKKLKGVSIVQTTRAQVEGERGWFWVIAPMLRADCDGADFQGLTRTIEVGDNAHCRNIPARFALSQIDGLPISTAAQRITSHMIARCEGKAANVPITLSDGTREVKVETDCAQFSPREIPVISAESNLFESAQK